MLLRRNTTWTARCFLVVRSLLFLLRIHGKGLMKCVDEWGQGMQIHTVVLQASPVFHLRWPEWYFCRGYSDHEGRRSSRRGNLSYYVRVLCLLFVLFFEPHIWQLVFASSLSYLFIGIDKWCTLSIYSCCCLIDSEYLEERTRVLVHFISCLMNHEMMFYHVQDLIAMFLRLHLLVAECVV